MKSHLFLFLGLLSALTCGCKKEKTEPKDEGISFEFEASETIGPEGGTVETDGFSLTVPAGAFDSETELVLLSATDKQTFGDNLVSGMFKIEGIPVEYGKPLRVKIKYEGSLSEESYIALGEEVFVSSLDSVITAFQFIEAGDSSGWLIGEIPIPENSHNQSGSKKKSANETDFTGFILGCLTSYIALYSENQHFLMYYPLFMASSGDVTQLGKYLEEAYSFFQTQLGFSYSNRTNWPVKVVVCPFPLSYNALGFYTNSRLGNNGGWIEFNYDALPNRKDIRTTAGHEFFHLVQSLYDNRNRISKAQFAANHHWFNEATAVWSESNFSDDVDFQSDIVKGNQMAPFNGLHAGSLLSKDSVDHGYGMLSLIHYLEGIYGSAFILKTYQSLFDEGSHIIDAISKHTSEPVNWLEDFFRQYITGKLNVYQVDMSFFYTRVHDVLSIKDKNNVDTLLRSNYPDLSARIFSVVLEDKSIDDDDNLIITTEGLTEITLIKWIPGQNSKVEVVANSTGKITVGKLKSDYMDNKARMFVLITNFRTVPPYTGKTYYDVNFKMEHNASPPDWNICSVRINVLGNFQETSPEGTKEFVLERPYGNAYEGSFIDNNTYIGNYYYQDDEITVIGEMRVILNNTRDTVKSFTFTENLASKNFNDNVITSFSGINVPKMFTIDYFYIKSESICSGNIVSLSFDRISNNVDGKNETLLNYSCTSNSWIEVWFGTDK